MATKRHTFPSLARAGVRYTLHTDSAALWDSAYHSCKPLSPYTGEYQTMGDGTCQHGYERAVTVQDPAVFSDYCASLATYLLALPQKDEEDLHYTLSRILDTHSREEITFALSVRYVEGKTAFYNKSDRKVSSRASLAHDKRWEPVTKYDDGSVRSAQRIIAGDCSVYMLELWADIEQIREIASDLGCYNDYDVARRTLWQDSSGEIPESLLDATAHVFDAWRALKWAIEGILARRNAVRTLECYHSNVTNAARRRQRDTDADATPLQAVAL